MMDLKPILLFLSAFKMLRIYKQTKCMYNPVSGIIKLHRDINTWVSYHCNIPCNRGYKWIFFKNQKCEISLHKFSFIHKYKVTLQGKKYIF